MMARQIETDCTQLKHADASGRIQYASETGHQIGRVFMRAPGFENVWRTGNTAQEP